MGLQLSICVLCPPQSDSDKESNKEKRMGCLSSSIIIWARQNQASSSSSQCYVPNSRLGPLSTWFLNLATTHQVGIIFIVTILPIFPPMRKWSLEKLSLKTSELQRWEFTPMFTSFSFMRHDMNCFLISSRCTNLHASSNAKELSLNSYFYNGKKWCLLFL